jgi:hypothetical protein
VGCGSVGRTFSPLEYANASSFLPNRVVDKRYGKLHSLYVAVAPF